MKPRSAKAKGRRGSLEVKDALLAAFPSLKAEDIVVKTTSEPGVDIHLSPAARLVFPFGIEVKNTEKLNLWAALEQAEDNAKAEGLPPVVFFKRNRSELYVALKATDFLKNL